MPHRPMETDVRTPPAASRTFADGPAYELRLTQTQDATGYFMPVPLGEPGFEEVRAYLETHPNDEFMHRYGLQQVLQMPAEAVPYLVDQAAGYQIR